MSKTKKQHYIPKFYLKNFSNTDGFLSIYTIGTKKQYNGHYKNQCQEKYFYDKDNSIEKELSKKESIWSKIINETIRNECIDKKYESELKKFAIYQKNRTKLHNIKTQENFWESYKIGLEIKANQQNLSLSKEFLEEEKRKYIANNKLLLPSESLKLIKDMHKYIDDLELILIKYNTTEELIVSDNPIIHYNNFNILDTGYNNAGLIIFFPISPKLLIVIFDPKMYKHNTQKTIHSNNNYEVKYLNYFQIANCNNLVFSHHNSNVDKYCKKKMLQNILNSPVHDISTLGPATEKLIQIKSPFINIKHNFSFAKLPYCAVNIKRQVKDWIPRFPDNEYKKRMQFRENDFINIIECAKKDGHLNNTKIIFNQNDIIQYNKFINNYWADKL